MLLRRAVLDRIVTGEIDLAFRRWTRPTVKTGGSLRTAVGMLQIEKVEPVEISEIGEEDARRAGLDLAELVAFLNRKTEGEVYRVELGAVVDDPREALREHDDLSDADLEEIRARLHRLDRPRNEGPGPGSFSTCSTRIRMSALRTWPKGSVWRGPSSRTMSGS